MSSAQSQTAAAIGSTHGHYIEESVYSVLSAAFSGKVYPSIAPDGAVAPYAVQTTITSVPENTLADDEVMSAATIQLDIYAGSLVAARAVADTATAAMKTLFNGVIGITKVADRRLYDSDVRLHRIEQEYSILLPRGCGTS